MRIYLDKKVVAGFVVTAVILLGMGVYSFLNNRAVVQSANWVAHTKEVLYHTENVLSSVVNIESGSRGYILTGDEQYLEPYQLGMREVGEHLDRLRALTLDNPRQQARIRSLQAFINEKKTFASKLVDSAAAMQPVAGLPQPDKKIMADIRHSVAAIKAEEDSLLKERTAETERRQADFNTAFFVWLGITLAVLIVLFFMIHYNMRARAQAEEKLQQALAEIGDLYNNAPCGYHSLNVDGEFLEMNRTLLHWLGYSREEMIGKKKFEDILAPDSLSGFQEQFTLFKKNGYANDVEFVLTRKNGTTFPVILNSSAVNDSEGNYLRSRTTLFNNTDRKLAEQRINQLNKELEAFTYSVSHDLRAPLRSIHGYSQILQDEYSDVLDDNGRRVLAIVMRNAKKMGQLIDDLLDFSRLGRKEISRVKVNMNDMVHAVASEVMAQHKSNPVNLHIKPLAMAWGDPGLLRQVWTNFISNAVKYTGKKDQPFVEVGCNDSVDETVYYIRDNGVGFDMQYVAKLFNVFQRLHKETEFEGTGVGLALVSRIVTRHGGRVWAEGELNKGATFYFALPKHEATAHAQELKTQNANTV